MTERFLKFRYFCLLFTIFVSFAVEQWIDFSGTIDLYNEIYISDNDERDKPSSTIRAMFIDPDIYLFDRAVRLNFQFRLTTEEDKNRQSLQRVVINPKWDWGELHLWDFSPSMTGYTLGGRQVTGAGFSLYPGNFKASFYMGQTQRAVVSSGRNAAFKQNMFAANIGVGSENDDFIKLNISRFIDDVESIDDSLVYQDTIAIGNYFGDSLFMHRDTSLKYLTITPKENLVASIDFRKSLSSSFSVDGEFATSFHTRNSTASLYDEDDSPIGSFLANLFDFRHSSNYDFAYNLGTNLKLQDVNWKLSFEEIYPGFVSLGVPSLRGDRRTMSSSATWTTFGRKLRLSNSISYNEDNLFDQNLYTNSGFSVNSSAIIMPIHQLSLNLSHNYMNRANDTKSDTNKIDYTLNAVNIGVGYVMNIGNQNYSVNANYASLISNNRLIMADMEHLQNTFSIGFSIPIIPSVSTVPSFTVTTSKIDSDKTSTMGISNNTSFRFFKNSLSGNIRTSINIRDDSNNLRLSTRWRYSPFEAKYGSFFFEYRFSDFNSDGIASDFTEQIFRLGYENRF